MAAATFVAVESAGEDTPAPSPARAQSAADRGRGVFARMGCGNCHRLAAANAKGEIGPDLDEALAPYSATALRAKIVDPYAGIDTGGFAMMPEDFGERLTARQLSDLVAFLLASRGSTASP